MKNVFAIGLAALALVAMSGQPTAAWVNARVGLGVNLGWQSGGNHFCWGLWHNGEPPPAYGYDHGHHHSQHAPSVYLPYFWAGDSHHTHHQPAPSFNTFTPMQFQYSAPSFYFYQPE